MYVVIKLDIRMVIGLNILIERVETIEKIIKVLLI